MMLYRLVFEVLGGHGNGTLFGHLLLRH